MQRNIGLVLSGGSAKGAYEAGVWRALTEMDIISRIDGKRYVDAGGNKRKNTPNLGAL